MYSKVSLKDPVALAMYPVERAGVGVAGVDFNEVLESAVLHIERPRLRTLDLLHVTASSVLSCRSFITLDAEIINKSEV